MINGSTIYLVAATLLGSCAPTIAAGIPQLVLQMNHGLLAGTVMDGTKLGRATLVSYDTHTGFQLWAEQALTRQQAGRYVLTGEQNPLNEVRVRLVAQKLPVMAVPDTLALIVNTNDDRVVFDILVDGKQTVVADNYPLNINAALLLPQA